MPTLAELKLQHDAAAAKKQARQVVSDARNVQAELWLARAEYHQMRGGSAPPKVRHERKHRREAERLLLYGRRA